MQRDSDILEAFGRVRSWTHGDHRAPHKPLLLLLALAALQRGERWVRFAEIEVPLRNLLLEFGPPRATPRAEYPFWRLQQDSIWTVPDAADLRSAMNASGDVPVTMLRARNTSAGFTDAIYNALAPQPELVNVVAAQILTAAFPPSVHQDILEAGGFQWTVIAVRKRDRRFREEVLRIYERRCAVCGYDGRLGLTDLAIEASHIKWHAAGGPDSLENGLALCSFHHVALDRGAITIDDNLQLQVSQDVVGSSQVEILLLNYAGCPVRPPQRGTPAPSPTFLAWHRQWVFRPPARAAS